MKNSTLQAKPSKVRRAAEYGAAVLFWLALWHIASLRTGNGILLVSPLEAAKRLLSLLATADFWRTAAFSFLRIMGGFFAALALGILLAAAAAAVPFVRTLFSPVTAAVKATPAASFIILALIWIPSRNLALLISFLLAFPVIYTNTLTGILAVDGKLLEMARVFGIPPVKRLLYVYLPDVMPFLASACSVSIGFCWKSGIAAEVIGQPDGSIGDKLYKAKIYLETADLFAWTAVIILMSAAFERLFLLLIKALERKLSKGGMV